MSTQSLITRCLAVGLVLLMGWPGVSYGQLLSPEPGRPLYVERYATHLLNETASEQNLWVAQDSRGVIFIANWMGVLEFDGTFWRMHSIPNQFVRSLAIGPDDRVYVGGVGEIGVLIPDEHGNYIYESLIPLISDPDRSFADVWTTYAADDGVYFQSFRHIFRWDGRELTRWSSDTRFHKGFSVRGKFYTRQEGVGLMRAFGATLDLIDGGERFAEERIDAMLPFREGGLMILARTQGALILHDGRFERLSADLDRYIREERIYHGTALNDSTFALSTLSGTVLIFHEAGSIIQVLGEDVGLTPDDLVLHVTLDKQGGLWLALDRGLIRADASAPVRLFNQEDGLRGSINQLGRHQWLLYAATSHGLYEIVSSSPVNGSGSGSTRFRSHHGITEAVWSLHIVRGRLLAAADDGVYDVTSSPVQKILEGRAFTLEPSRMDGDLAYVGLKEGIALLRWTGLEWVVEERISPAWVGEVRSIVEDDDGNIWLGTVGEGVVKVSNGRGAEREVQRFGESHGLGSATVAVTRENGELAFVTKDGAYRLSDSRTSTRFVPDGNFNDRVQLAQSEAHLTIASEMSPRTWVIRDRQIAMFERSGRGDLIDATPAALRFRGLSAGSVYEEPEGTIWVTTDRGLVRYDPTIANSYEVPYTALIRQVITGNGDVLFAGALHPGYRFPEVPHTLNNIRFEYAAPTYNSPAQTLFQYWLEGFEEGWSDWSHATSKEYTNLPERSYRFHVRALNAQGVISEVGTFPFRVLPPWYRTWWAYACYLTLGAVILWGYGRWRIREHSAAFERERDVRQHIEMANARLKKANERLHLADKLKDDLLANTSHELRTPLTSILGFAAVLHEELSGEHRDFAAHIQRGGHRLLDTVDALLDMARFQADVITVDPDDIDVLHEVMAIIAPLEKQAVQKGLFLKIVPEGMSIPARIDAGALERIVTNLVNNAVKFTNQGGVTVLLDADATNIYLTVKDTGIGIRREFLPNLFSAFSQASTGYARTYEGNGLGLAITHRLIRVLDGDIEVDSAEESGSVFRVRLPRWAESASRAVGCEADGAVYQADRRILLIEDDRALGSLATLIGGVATLDMAAQVDEAVRLAYDHKYDVVLVPGHYDGGTAKAALAELRTAPGTCHARFVAVTPFAMPGDREHFQAMGFDEHIGEPLTRNRLILTLDILLSRGKGLGVEPPDLADVTLA